jgi:hypothetical protein
MCAVPSIAVYYTLTIYYYCISSSGGGSSSSSSSSSSGGSGSSKVVPVLTLNTYGVLAKASGQIHDPATFLLQE